MPRLIRYPMKFLSPVLLVAACATLIGCGKEEASSTPAPAPAPAPAVVDVTGGSAAPTPPPAAPVPPPPVAPGAPAPAAGAAPAPAASSGPGLMEGVAADYQSHLVNLNNAFQNFRSVEMRSPNDLNELVKAGLITEVPPAPPGKQWKIDAPNLRIIAK